MGASYASFDESVMATAFGAAPPPGELMAEAERKWQTTISMMLTESAGLEHLVGRRVVNVKREVIPERWARHGDLLVTLELDDGSFVQLRGTSHYYDGEDASIEAVALT